MEIRRIKDLIDVEQCYAMGKEMHDESSFKHLEFDKDAIVHYAALSMQPDSDLYVSVYILDDGDYAGFMFAGINPFYFSPSQKVAQDYALFLRKQYRGTLAARGVVGLIKDFERWAKKKGAMRLQLGVTTGVNEESTISLYERLGYGHLGQLMYKEI